MAGGGDSQRGVPQAQGQLCGFGGRKKGVRDGPQRVIAIGWAGREKINQDLAVAVRVLGSQACTHTDTQKLSKGLS